MKKNIFFLLGLLLITLSVVSLQSLVKAQLSGQSLEVSPPSQELQVDPGQTKTVKAKLTNKSNDTLPIAAHIEDFSASGEEGQVELSAGGTWSVVSWTKVTPTRFTLGPGESKEVTATISVPKDAAGGRYGSFVFGVEANPDTTQSAAALSQQIASLFLLRISGPVNEKLSLEQLSAPKLSEFGPVPFLLRFKNEGNVYTKTYGLINVSDMFGRKVSDIVVTGTNVFPSSTRNIYAKLNKKFLIGKYTATAVMYYGTSQPDTLTSTVTFYVFPLRLFIPVAVLLLICFLARKRLKKALKALFGK